MNTHIQKWGNSLAVRIPKNVAEEVGLKPNDEVEITLQNGQIVLKPITNVTYSLDELLAGITPENLHDEWDTGTSVGKEVW